MRLLIHRSTVTIEKVKYNRHEALQYVRTIDQSVSTVRKGNILYKLSAFLRILDTKKAWIQSLVSDLTHTQQNLKGVKREVHSRAMERIRVRYWEKEDGGVLEKGSAHEGVEVF